jgi:excisionase family DNA binding protein
MDTSAGSNAAPGAPEWMTADDAASYLRLSGRKAVYQAVRRGQLPSCRLGTRLLRFRRADLDRVLLMGQSSGMFRGTI